jgi:hypothetical protein
MGTPAMAWRLMMAVRESLSAIPSPSCRCMWPLRLSEADGIWFLCDCGALQDKRVTARASALRWAWWRRSAIRALASSQVMAGCIAVSSVA